MKLSQRDDIETNVSNVTTFGVVEGSHLFKMLSDYLYSDKYLCVVHELAANCIDAHQLNGKDNVPFEIHLPSKLDSYITFRDFGPGLSEEDVRYFLCNYGATNKSNSDRPIGGFGIGFKSVAAVSDTWNVLSYHNGIKTSYAIFINEQGVPSLTKFHEEPTTETGIAIHIPTTSINENKWRTAIDHAFKFYKVPPSILTPEGLTKIVPTFGRLDELNRKGWLISNSNNSFNVVVNQRQYKVPENIKLQFGWNDSIFAKDTIILYFETGEIDVSISRETLQFTSKTVAAINSKIAAITLEIEDDIKRVLSLDRTLSRIAWGQEIEGLVEKYLTPLDHRRPHDFLYKLLMHYASKKYDIVSLSQTYLIEVAWDKVWDLKEYVRRNGKFNLSGAKANDNTVIRYGNSLRKKHIKDEYKLILTVNARSTAIVIDDATFVVARIKEKFLNSREINTVLCVSPDAPIPDYLSELVFKASDLPFTRARSTKKPSVGHMVYLYSSYYRGPFKVSVDEVNKLVAEGTNVVGIPQTSSNRRLAITEVPYEVYESLYKQNYRFISYKKVPTLSCRILTLEEACVKLWDTKYKGCIFESDVTPSNRFLYKLFATGKLQSSYFKEADPAIASLNVNRSTDANRIYMWMLSKKLIERPSASASAIEDDFVERVLKRYPLLEYCMKNITLLDNQFIIDIQSYIDMVDNS